MAKRKNHSSTNDYKWTKDVLVIKDICFECGENKDIHYHHVIPEAKGGTKTLPLCIICHGKVHNRDFMKIKELQRVGIEKAKLKGLFKGRKKNTVEPSEKFLLKPKSKKIKEYLLKGYTKAQIIKLADSSFQTIYKVEKLIKSELVDVVPLQKFKEEKRPIGFWDIKENCYSESIKHKNETHFKLNCSDAYKAAVKNKWIYEFFPNTIRKKNKNIS